MHTAEVISCYVRGLVHRESVQIQRPEVVMHNIAFAFVPLVHNHCVTRVQVQPVSLQ